MQVLEDVLSNLGLLRGGCASELVEVAIKPFVDFCMLGVVVVANLLWGHAFLTSLGLGSGTVLVSATNVDDIVASESCVPRVHIC